MERTDYIATLKTFATRLGPQRPRDEAERTAYVGKLIELATKLKTSDRSPHDAASEAVRTVLQPKVRDILWRVAGATLERRRSLPAASREALRVLEGGPDLLGPLGYARTEVAHSAAIAFFLDPVASGPAGRDCLRAFVDLVVKNQTGEEASDLPDSLDLASALVTAERVVGTGRVDVSLDAPKALVFIEVKVDAAEGREQLTRYAKALDELAGGRDSLLVYLTLDGESTSETQRPHRHITFRDLLRVWLPIAASARAAESTYLAMYLKTIAQHLHTLAGAGEFDRWNLHTQRAALAFIEQGLET